jgi:hypothetical protein
MIPKYGPNNSIYYKRTFKSFESLFKEMYIQSNKYNTSLSKLFSENCQIDDNGSIPKDIFFKICFSIEIQYSQKINELTIYLVDDDDRNKFKLTQFLGIYYLFYLPNNNKKIIFNFLHFNNFFYLFK